MTVRRFGDALRAWWKGFVARQIADDAWNLWQDTPISFREMCVAGRAARYIDWRYDSARFCVRYEGETDEAIAAAFLAATTCVAKESISLPMLYPPITRPRRRA